MTTREERIEAMARAIKKDDGNNCISSRGLCKNVDGCICRSLANTDYDALLAMGAIAEYSPEKNAHMTATIEAAMQSARRYGIGVIGPDGEAIRPQDFYRHGEPEQKD